MSRPRGYQVSPSKGLWSIHVGKKGTRGQQPSPSRHHLLEPHHNQSSNNSNTNSYSSNSRSNSNSNNNNSISSKTSTNTTLNSHNRKLARCRHVHMTLKGSHYASRSQMESRELVISRSKWLRAS
mmetsp:Transcript_35535/g.76710  ORF Transcript_35535/g.76710 Transcript_35535/m.76710 type:complete len:125 (+) Transcript_35535:646-1020(+)